MRESTTFQDPKRQRITAYIVLAVIAAGLVVIGLLTFNTAKQNRAAEEKADQLVAALQQAGLTSPDRDQIIRTLGDDGAAVCADPGNALKKAIRDGLGTNGAAGPGLRPVFIAERFVRGEALVLQVYCPDQLPEFLRYVDGLKLADVHRE